MGLFSRGEDAQPSTASIRLSRLLGLDDGSAGGWVPAQPAGESAVPPKPEIRVRASPEALVWLLVAGLGVILVAGYFLSHHRGGGGGAAPSASAPSAVAVPAVAPLQLVVDVDGRVRHPGLVTLAQGARVADAIRAAGGVLHAKDLVGINLAARVADGQLLLIGVAGGAPSGSAAGSGPLNLNSATVDQLDALPGVGPVLAQRIVSWRDAHGGFRSVDDLQQVTGIGPSKFDDLKTLVAV